MKKYGVLLILLFFFFEKAFAKHISGGEMSYIYLGAGTNPGTLKYQVTLKLYRDCNAPSDAAQLDPTAVFTVFNAATFAQIQNITGISGSNTQIIQKIPDNPCIEDAIESAVCFQYKIYTTIIDNLPVISAGYIVAYQRCCRIDGMANISSTSVGSTYFALIPGNLNAGAQTNTSPVFASNDAVLICSGRPITFDFHATDADGDNLVYQFYNAFSGGSSTNTAPNPAGSPPYEPVSYINGYSDAQPLGSLVSINSSTGLISGIAPDLGPGANSIFAITVLVSEYRAGIKIGQHFKDLQIRVVDCRVTTALLKPREPICNSFDVAFQNDVSNNPEPTYFWNFGDPASGINNTSISNTPSHSFTAAGTYQVKMVLNQGQQCGDSAITTIKVYPGFFPDFTVAGQCKNTPVQFTDITTATYGVVDKWSWNFGDFSSTSNTSTIKSPTHVYASANNYNVQLIVSSSVGCIDTVLKTIPITDKPALTVSNDTLICVIDTLQLNAVGTGTFLWTPNYNISNVNISNPLVSPDVTTTYHVVLTDPFGCVGGDSVRVRVVNNVTQFAPNDTTICKTDGIVLNLVSDALNYQWTETPAGNTLNNSNIKNPIATPVANATTYSVVGSIGKCVAQNNVTIKVVPYPIANAGADPTICFGNSVQLSATGGSAYSWSPAAFLNNRLIPNPISVKPTANIRYIVTVTDTLGCPKPVRDTVVVFVAKITADAGPRDTSVVLNQPLLLQATGSTNYLWSPAQWLSNIGIANPVSLPLSDIEYIVKVSNDAGCFDYDSIRVHLFKVDAGLYVPNAFSPNGDGNNDDFKPIVLGMRSLDIFRVYNRWGQLLYSSTNTQKGWDGTFGGKAQDPATYVWYAEGIDYRNIKIKKKGYVVLIR
ncbi:PKD domain-containing protein [Ferruginibacter sp.]|nr:PKD domain-containing protein [Ferruginibacter sp.]